MSIPYSVEAAAEPRNPFMLPGLGDYDGSRPANGSGHC